MTCQTIRDFERLIAHAATFVDSQFPVILAGDFNVVPPISTFTIHVRGGKAKQSGALDSRLASVGRRSRSSRRARSAESYLRQADEIFAKTSGATENISHPESYIRARALRLWAQQGGQSHVGSNAWSLDLHRLEHAGNGPLPRRQL